MCVCWKDSFFSESDSMIEICGKLDKSNTLHRFRCVIFRSGFISSSRTSSRLRLFCEFFYLKVCEENGGGIVVAGNFGRDLKSNVSGYIKDFFFFAFSDHLTFSLSSSQLQPRHHNRDNFLWHHFIVNIFSMKQVMPKPLSHEPFPTSFLSTP